MRLVDEAQQALIASRCDACNHTAFPARYFCPACGSSGPFQEVLIRRGKLSTFTLCHVAPAGFDTPYLAAWVTFPEGPTVFGVLRLVPLTLRPPLPQGERGPEGEGFRGVRGGDPVEVVIVPRESGPGWEFHPI